MLGSPRFFLLVFFKLLLDFLCLQKKWSSISHFCNVSVTKVACAYPNFSGDVGPFHNLSVMIFLYILDSSSLLFFFFFLMENFEFRQFSWKILVRDLKVSLKRAFPTSKIDFGRVVLFLFAHFLFLIFHFFGSKSSRITIDWSKLTGKNGRSSITRFLKIYLFRLFSTTTRTFLCWFVLFSLSGFSISLFLAPKHTLISSRHII